MNIQNSVCFTGHRHISKAETPDLLSSLYSTVMELYSDGYTDYICGGAIGFDTLAAECVIAMRERFPDIVLSLYLPCRSQTEKWTSLDQLNAYKNILGKANHVKYISDFYTQSCMRERNRLMVDSSRLCVAYLKSIRGGTASTVKYARQKGLEIINLYNDPDQISFIQ